MRQPTNNEQVGEGIQFGSVDKVDERTVPPKKQMPPATGAVPHVGFERWLAGYGIALTPADRTLLLLLGDLDGLKSAYVAAGVQPTLAELRTLAAKCRAGDAGLEAFTNLHPATPNQPPQSTRQQFDVDATSAGDHSHLYEIHRRALITRHLCQDGFLACELWMKELSDDDIRYSAPSPFQSVAEAKRHMRCRPERYAAQDGSVPEGTFCFMPLENAGRVVMGGSENHLLNAGLALAVFSLEALDGVSQFSGEYAHMLFNGILKAELHANGMLYRSPIDGTTAVETRYASTDDLLGVCVGLMFYKEYLDLAISGPTTSGTAKLEAARNALIAFAGRIGRVLDQHGCFYVPPSNQHDVSLEFTEKLACVFTYPLKCLFGKLCGVKLENEWDWDEYKAYFSEVPGDELSGDNITSYDNKLIADFAHIFDLSSESHFELFAGLYAAALDGTLDTFLNNAPGARELWALVKVTLDLAGVSTPRIADLVLTEKFFNLHLTALAFLIMHVSGGTASTAVSFLRAVLNGKLSDSSLPDVDRYPGRRNALFAAIAAIIEPGCRSQPEVKTALDFLCAGSSDTIDRPLQHDGPLAINDGLAKLLNLPPSPPRFPIATKDMMVAFYKRYGKDWVPRLQELHPLTNLNPFGQSGMERMFEKPQNSQYGVSALGSGARDIVVPLLLKRNEPYRVDASGRCRNATVNGAPLGHFLTATVEYADVTWLFAKALASHFLRDDQKFRVKLQSDVGLSPLPYRGHFPVVK